MSARLFSEPIAWFAAMDVLFSHTKALLPSSQLHFLTVFPLVYLTVSSNTVHRVQNTCGSKQQCKKSEENNVENGHCSFQLFEL